MLYGFDDKPIPTQISKILASQVEWLNAQAFKRLKPCFQFSNFGPTLYDFRDRPIYDVGDGIPPSIGSTVTVNFPIRKNV